MLEQRFEIPLIKEHLSILEQGVNKLLNIIDVHVKLRYEVIQKKEIIPIINININAIVFKNKELREDLNVGINIQCALHLFNEPKYKDILIKDTLAAYITKLFMFVSNELK